MVCLHNVRWEFVNVNKQLNGSRCRQTQGLSVGVVYEQKQIDNKPTAKVSDLNTFTYITTCIERQRERRKAALDFERIIFQQPT